MMIQFKFFADDESTQPSHGAAIDLPLPPRVGDHISLTRPDQEGYSTYLVRRVVWHLSGSGPGTVDQAGAVTVECVFTIGPYTSEEFRETAPGGG